MYYEVKKRKHFLVAPSYPYKINFMLCAFLHNGRVFIFKNKRGIMAYYDTPDNTAKELANKYGITKALARASANRCRAVDELRFDYWDSVLDVLKSMKPKKKFKT